MSNEINDRQAHDNKTIRTVCIEISGIELEKATNELIKCIDIETSTIESILRELNESYESEDSE